MDMDRLLQQSLHTPNVDVEWDGAAADLSGAVSLGTVAAPASVSVVDPTTGLAAGDQPALELGPLRNAPPEGAITILRVAGFAEFVFGDTIEEGWLTKNSEVPGDEGKLVPWVPGADGHTHVAAITPIKHVFMVTDPGSGDAPVPGIDPADLTVTLEYDDTSGTLAAAAETVTVTEDGAGGGVYWAAVSPTVLGVLYRMRIAYTGGGGPYEVMPNQFQDVSTATYGTQLATSLRRIRGQCVKRGDAGDTGVIFLWNQVL